MSDNITEKMTINNRNITFKRLDKNDQIPYELLLLADPSKDLVDEYLNESDIFIARQNDETIGVLVLFPLTAEAVEIKNIAIKPEFQGQGVGSYLIESVVQTASLDRQESICIGTANSSVGQLYLYQKLGFEITEIRKDFFIQNYAEPIYENGIQAKHMLVLTRQLLQQIKIRKGQLDDLSEIQHLFVETVKGICKTDYNSEQINVWTSGIENKQRWQDILTNQFVMISEDNQKITGFCTLDKGNYVDLLYVHKDHQRQGIAYKLYKEIEKEAKRQGQTELTSDVSKTARPFFVEMGFNVLKQQTVNVKGVELVNYKMTKNIA